MFKHTVVEPAPPVVETASEYLGLTERVDRAQLTQLVGVDPVRTQWCAAFVNAILEINNIPGSSSVSEHPLLARSFLQWGTTIEPQHIQRGDIVVFPRGNSDWQGHVGFYVSTLTVDGAVKWAILGGNQDNTVSLDYYDPQRALAVRRWQTVEPILVTAVSRS